MHLEMEQEGTLKEFLGPVPARQSKRKKGRQLNRKGNKRQRALLIIRGKCAFKCTWVNHKLKEKELVLYLSRDETVGDLLEEAKKQVDLSENGSGRLRLLDIISHKIHTVLREDMKLESFVNAIKNWRVEEILRDEIDLAEDEMLIPVAHYQEVSFNTFGVPFLLKVKDQEPFSQVKERIQLKLEVSDEEFETYNIAVITMAGEEPILLDMLLNLPGFRPPAQIGDEVPYVPWLGLEHENNSP